MIIKSKIHNSHLLTNVFGRLPSFHDAEVLNIRLERNDTLRFSPTLCAAIHVFEVTAQVDKSGRYTLKNHVVVDFKFFQIVELSLEDFNHQNVLQDLSIVDISDRQLELAKFEVLFDGIYGVSAKFQCKEISIESVEPYVFEQS